jgi:hypothetical protein
MPYNCPFAAIRVFSGQKKSGAVVPHSKISACPAVASREGGCYSWDPWSGVFRSVFLREPDMLAFSSIT